MLLTDRLTVRMGTAKVINTNCAVGNDAYPIDNSAGETMPEHIVIYAKVG